MDVHGSTHTRALLLINHYDGP